MNIKADLDIERQGPRAIVTPCTWTQREQAMEARLILRPPEPPLDSHPLRRTPRPQVYMYPEGTGPPDLSAAFDTQLREEARPSAAALLRLRRAGPPPPLIPLPRIPTAPDTAVAAQAVCDNRLTALAAALSAESPACAAAAAALVADDNNDSPPAPVAAAVCASGCVPRARAALGEALAECARAWAAVPVLEGDLDRTNGPVPILRNTSWLLQVAPPPCSAPIKLPSPTLSAHCTGRRRPARDACPAPVRPTRLWRLMEARPRSAISRAHAE
jgi:hypothetical protein